MKNQNNREAAAAAPKEAGSLEAPLVLSADQLELVAGGMAAIKPGGPTNGLVRVAQ